MNEIPMPWERKRVTPPKVQESGDDGHRTEPTPVQPVGAAVPGPRSEGYAQNRNGLQLLSGKDFIQQAGEVRWIWPGWIPAGMVTLLCGIQGEGKTTVSLTLASLLTRGGTWPTGEPIIRGRALYVPAEGADTEIAEKVRRVGAENVDILRKADGSYLPLVTHYREIRRVGEGYALIIFDSITAHALGDLRKSEKARYFMNALTSIARETGAAVVSLHHLRKKTVLDLGEAVTQDQVRDSQDLLASARQALALWRGRDGYLVLGRIKSNLVSLGPTLCLDIDDDGVSWLGEVAPESGDERNAVGWERCARWLAEQLKGGAQLSADVRRKALEAGFTAKQIRQARDVVVKTIRRLGNGSTLWEA